MEKKTNKFIYQTSSPLKLQGKKIHFRTFKNTYIHTHTNAYTRAAGNEKSTA